MIKRYFWVLIVGLVGVTAFGLLLLVVLGMRLPAVAIFVPAGIAAIDAGRIYARNHGIMPAFSVGNALALRLLLVTILTYVVTLVGSTLTQGWSLGSLFALLGQMAFPLILFVLLFFLTIRVMFWVGVRMAL